MNHIHYTLKSVQYDIVQSYYSNGNYIAKKSNCTEYLKSTVMS